MCIRDRINTYPDSEYLAKAKLSVADSYYKEGGTSSTTQAISEYKDFITFFPFLDEAAYAQMQVGMAHYRMMEKADRDSTQAQAAEDEFQAFILKYPQSPLAVSYTHLDVYKRQDGRRGSSRAPAASNARPVQAARSA